MVEGRLRGHAGRTDHDREAGALRKPDQLNVAERMGVAARRDGQGHAAREAAEEPGGLLDDAVEFASGLAEFVGDPAGVFGRQGLRLHQLVDVGTIAGIRGDAARRGMRLHEVPAGLQLGHLVADGRRADAQIVLLSKRVRADGFGGGYILVDDRC